MSIPSYGAMPLSKTFCLVRIMQIIAMIIIIGVAANLISLINSTGVEAPREFVGALSVTCIATLYVLISTVFYYSQANLGLLVMFGIDSLLLIAFIVVAVTVGKPLSFLNCMVIGKSSAEVDAQSAYAFTTSMMDNLNKTGLGRMAGATRTNCFQSKTVWGMSIALCILFTTSCILLPTLWYKNKKATPAPKSMEEA